VLSGQEAWLPSAIEVLRDSVGCRSVVDMVVSGSVAPRVSRDAVRECRWVARAVVGARRVSGKHSNHDGVDYLGP
jgi:hypothetical protein